MAVERCQSGCGECGADVSVTPDAVLLEARSITKRFGGVAALDGCSLSVVAGRVTGLIGPNGSGKTTLFNVLTGYLAADDGDVMVDEKLVRRPSPQRLYRMGVVRTFQYARLFPELTPVEILALAAVKPFRSVFRGKVDHRDREQAMLILEELGLLRVTSHRAGQLSYGQQRLLEFGTTLMAQPRLVLLDEPAAGVSPAMIEVIEKQIRALRAGGVGFLLVEHQLDLVMRLCDSVVVMAGGKPIASGTPDEVRQNEGVLEAYLGN